MLHFMFRCMQFTERHLSYADTKMLHSSWGRFVALYNAARACCQPGGASKSSLPALGEYQQMAMMLYQCPSVWFGNESATLSAREERNRMAMHIAQYMHLVRDRCSAGDFAVYAMLLLEDKNPSGYAMLLRDKDLFDWLNENELTL